MVNESPSNSRENFRAWYKRVFPELTGSGLWLRGGEINTLPASEADSRDFRMLITRLSTYQDTADSFSHLLIYQWAATVPGCYPDLAYLPPPSDVPLFKKDGVPWLLGTQSKFAGSAFDVIGFSNSIVQELVNLPAFLRESGIPLSKSERMNRPDLPLILLGGANAAHSTVAWPWIDAVFVGESGSDVRRLIEICRDGKRAGLSKVVILARLVEEVPGLIEPGGTSKKKSFACALEPSEAPSHIPVMFTTERMGEGFLPISEGCPCVCNFCAESWTRKPYREVPAEQAVRTALEAKARLGLDSIDLFSFNFNIHSEFPKLAADLSTAFRKIGLKSQRLDALAREPRLLELEQVLEKSSFTFGIEGISERLRRYLHKNLSNAELEQGLRRVFQTKPREIKLFLIATGLENQEDLEEFSKLLELLRELHGYTSGTRIVLSMTPLVRFPWTPLEFADSPDRTVLRRVLDQTAARTRQVRFEFREAASLEVWQLSQILARARDSRLGTALLQTIEKTGFIYYRDVPAAFMAAFEKALSEAGLTSEELLKVRKGVGEEPPWAQISTGISREVLTTLFDRAENAEAETDKPAPFSKKAQWAPIASLRERLLNQRRAEMEIRLQLQTGDRAVGLPRRYLGLVVARALMLGDHRLVPLYRGYVGSYWDLSGGQPDKPCWIVGSERLTLRWLPGAEPLLQKDLQNSVFRAAVAHELEGWARIEGLLTDVTPAPWAPAGLRIESPFAFRPDDYLKSHGLKHTLRKDAQSRIYEFTPEARKKKILITLDSSQIEGFTAVELRPGPKFSLEDFLKTFATPSPRDQARLRITSR